MQKSKEEYFKKAYKEARKKLKAIIEREGDNETRNSQDYLRILTTEIAAQMQLEDFTMSAMQTINSIENSTSEAKKEVAQGSSLVQPQIIKSLNNLYNNINLSACQ